MKKISILLVAAVVVNACGDRNGNDRIRRALDSFQVEKGLRVDLVVSEPLVIDPVAFAFDENRRMYVVEDRGYPDPAEGGNPDTIGRIALLEDTDGDGKYDRRHEFAADLTYPNGILPWKGGVFVTCSPHIYYFKDTDNDGVADVRKIVLTGFNDTQTSQIRMSHPTLGPDGWIYVTGGLNGGTITSPEHPEREAVTFKAADGRFHPETFEFEVTGGKSQFGLAIDPYGRRFGTSNRHPVMQVVMEPSYLRRNPMLLFNETVQNVSKVEAEAVVYPISKSVTTADYIPKLIGRSHAGTFTAASGLVVYNGTGLTAAHRGDVFICESAQNLVQRQVMKEDGPAFQSEIAEQGKEFLSSTDEWFRPVFAQHGPDGGLYIADMHRKVIDHPAYIPEEMRDKLDFKSGRTDGRIYRVVREDFDGKPDTVGRVGGDASVAEVVRALSSPDEWKRATAFRLLAEERNPDAIPQLKEGGLKGQTGEGRARALWLLSLHDALETKEVMDAMADKEAGVREQGTTIARHFIQGAPELLEAVLKAADDESPRVRYLAALALGDVSTPAATQALAKIAARDGDNKWTRAAVLSGISGRMQPFLTAFREQNAVRREPLAAVMQDLGRLFGNAGDVPAARSLFRQMIRSGNVEEWKVSALIGIAEGLSGKKKEVGHTDKGLIYAIAGTDAAARLEDFLKEVAAMAQDPNTSVTGRQQAALLFGFTTYEQALPVIEKLLDNRNPPDVQLAAVTAIARIGHVKGAELLTGREKWSAYSPRVKPAVISTLVASHTLIPVLFKAIEEGVIAAAEIPSADRSRLMKDKQAAISEKADALFGNLESGDRMKIYEEYKAVLTGTADIKQGEAVFQKSCSACHTYNGKGGSVGPDLTGTRNQPADALLLHIVVPNYEVYPAYQSVTIKTSADATHTGWVVSETESSLTLRTASGTDEAVLRSEIATLTNSGLSLMPDGLEQTMSKQEMADLIAYMKQGTN